MAKQRTRYMSYEAYRKAQRSAYLRSSTHRNAQRHRNVQKRKKKRKTTYQRYAPREVQNMAKNAMKIKNDFGVSLKKAWTIVKRRRRRFGKGKMIIR